MILHKKLIAFINFINLLKKLMTLLKANYYVKKVYDNFTEIYVYFT